MFLMAAAGGGCHPSMEPPNPDAATMGWLQAADKGSPAIDIGLHQKQWVFMKGASWCGKPVRQQIVVSGRESRDSAAGWPCLVWPEAAMKLLVVEDDLPLQSALQRLLGQWGYASELAGTGAEALAWLERELFDLVLLDLGLDRSRLARRICCLLKICRSSICWSCWRM